ncbi:MAG: hypothetical protein Q7S86_05280 [bacterium]|nr:hypothetical protein [bacterium]
MPDDELAFELTPGQRHAINELKHLGELNSDRELANLSFTVLKWVLEQRQLGRVITSLDEPAGQFYKLVGSDGEPFP